MALESDVRGNVDEVIETTTNLVEDRFRQGYDNAEEAFNTALAFVDELRTLTADIDVDIDIDDIIWDDEIINIQPFLADRPVNDIVDDLVVPTNAFVFSEDPYVSDLRDQLSVTLLTDIIEGGTGLTAATEAEIFAREEERDALENRERMDNMASEWAERNLPLPDGALLSSISQVDVEYQNKQLDKSRTIAERSEELGIKNKHFTVEQSKAWEAILMDYKSGVEDRSLKAAQAVMEAAIRVFDSLVKKYLAKVELYKADAMVYEASARAAVALMNAEIAKFGAITAKVKAQADIAVKKLDVLIREAELELAPKLEALKAAAQVSSQLAAGAMAGISASASLATHGSASQSASASEADTNGYQESHIHTYEEDV